MKDTTADLFGDLPPPPSAGPYRDLTPPAVRHSETSVAAAQSVASASDTMRATVYAAIRSAGSCGLTDEEGAVKLGMSGNTYRPRRCELVEMGWVIDSGETRATGSGRRAVVWVAKLEG